MELSRKWLWENKSSISHVVLFPLLLVASAVGGYYSHTPSVTTEEKIVYQERVVHEQRTIFKDNIVEKIVYVQQEEKHKSQDKKIVKIEKPDGTKIVTVHIKDKEDSSTKTNFTVDKKETVQLDESVKNKSETNLHVDTKTVVKYDQPGWRVGVGVGAFVRDLSLKEVKPIYSLEADRRIVGTLWLGLQLSFNTDIDGPKIVQGKVGFEF